MDWVAAVSLAESAKQEKVMAHCQELEQQEKVMAHCQVQFWEVVSVVVGDLQDWPETLDDQLFL